MKQRILQVNKQMSINKLLIQNKMLPYGKSPAVQVKSWRKESERICKKLLVQLDYSYRKNLSELTINKNNKLIDLLVGRTFDH